MQPSTDVEGVGARTHRCVVFGLGRRKWPVAIECCCRGSEDGCVGSTVGAKVRLQRDGMGDCRVDWDLLKRDEGVGQVRSRRRLPPSHTLHLPLLLSHLSPVLTLSPPRRPSSPTTRNARRTCPSLPPRRLPVRRPAATGKVVLPMLLSSLRRGRQRALPPSRPK